MLKKQFSFKILIPVLIFVCLFTACKSRYEKIRASTNLSLKYRTATYYFNKRDFTKALPLLEDLSTAMKGTQKAEDAQYYYAYCEYYLRDFQIARSLFKTFADLYPNSSRAEEARFMGARCSYQESPSYALDQENTVKAIDALQLFVNLYPHSSRLAECNKMIDELHGKLEEKSFQNAKLYYTVGNYKPAVIALKNSLRDFPDSKFREEMEFLILKCSYMYAEKSVISRQEDRFNDAIQAYQTFNENFGKSVFSKEAVKINGDSKRGLVKAKKTMSEYAAQEKLYEQQQKKLSGDSTSRKK